jgi:LPS export ABC transporter protein LptC
MISRGVVLGLLVVAAITGCRKDKAQAVRRVATTADSADQILYKMGVILTDRGVQRAELKADTGYSFEDNTRYELRFLTTTFFGKEGARTGVLTAKRGTYNLRANVMEARQDVVVLGVDGKKLTSPMVRFEQFRNMIVSDSPFVLTEGERRLEGIGFESDPQMLSVKVRQLSRGRGARIVLPSGPGRAPVFLTDSGQAPTTPAQASPQKVKR